ncbi:MAG: hypothetical protein WAP23_01940 [Candidatus Spechtbacterales bacterium]
MGSSSGTYTTPCPNCDGEVGYFWYDSDCRGNPAGGGIQCKKCKREFTSKEWQIIASDEMRERKRKEALIDLVFKARSIGQTVGESPEIITKLEGQLFSGNYPLDLDPEASHFHEQLLDYANAYKAISEI